MLTDMRATPSALPSMQVEGMLVTFSSPCVCEFLLHQVSPGSACTDAETTPCLVVQAMPVPPKPPSDARSSHEVAPGAEQQKPAEETKDAHLVTIVRAQNCQHKSDIHDQGAC